MTEGKNRFRNEYQRYLTSPEWKALRAAARARAGNQCEFCGSPPDHVHHVKYPKRYQEDHIDNLVVACETCHAKLHGIRDDVYVEDWVGTARAIKLANNEVVVEMHFDPLPPELLNPQPIKSFADRHGDKLAQELLNLFDGEFFVIGASYIKTIPLTHPLFDGRYNYSAADFVSDILTNDENRVLSVDNHEITAEAFIDSFSVGPVFCPCRLKEPT